jgi:hypothetical protein
MPIADETTETNAPHRPAMRRFAWDPRGTSRRAALYASHLQALRLETFLVRCQIDNPRNGERRALLALRLDAVDARAADIHARMIAARAA